METGKKFKIIKRKVLSENNNQNPLRKSVDDERASISSAKKSSFNENSFSIFDFDPDDLKNTLKDSSHFRYSRSQQSRSNHHENVGSNRNHLDIENVDSRLESILTR